MYKRQDYAALLDTLAARLGDDRAVHVHARFSRIAYTKGGEKCQLTFADTAFGPPHAPLLALLKEMCIRDSNEAKPFIAERSDPDKKKVLVDRKSTRLNSSHVKRSRMPSSA